MTEKENDGAEKTQLQIDAYGIKVNATSGIPGTLRRRTSAPKSWGEVKELVGSSVRKFVVETFAFFANIPAAASNVMDIVARWSPLSAKAAKNAGKAHEIADRVVEQPAGAGLPDVSEAEKRLERIVDKLAAKGVPISITQIHEKLVIHVGPENGREAALECVAQQIEAPAPAPEQSAFGEAVVLDTGEALVLEAIEAIRDLGLEIQDGYKVQGGYKTSAPLLSGEADLIMIEGAGGVGAAAAGALVGFQAKLAAELNAAPHQHPKPPLTAPAPREPAPAKQRKRKKPEAGSGSD